MIFFPGFVQTTHKKYKPCPKDGRFSSKELTQVRYLHGAPASKSCGQVRILDVAPNDQRHVDHCLLSDVFGYTGDMEILVIVLVVLAIIFLVKAI